MLSLTLYFEINVTLCLVVIHIELHPFQWFWCDSQHQFSLPSPFCWLYKTLVSAVLSRSDYYNSLLLGCSEHLQKYNKVQNSAPRLLLKHIKGSKYCYLLKAHQQNCVLPLLTTLLAAYPGMHWVQVVSTLWYSPSLSVWSSLCVLAIRAMIQWYVSASDIQICRGLCLGDVPFVQCINK